MFSLTTVSEKFSFDFPTVSSDVIGGGGLD